MVPIPVPVPRVVGLVITILWAVLFLFGAIRLMTQGEWGYALFCLVLGLLGALRVAQLILIMRMRRSIREASATSENSPIE